MRGGKYATVGANCIRPERSSPRLFRRRTEANADYWTTRLRLRWV